MAENISKNSVVTLFYQLFDQEKALIDESEPTGFSYLHGQNQMIPGFEAHMEGRSVGEQFDFAVPPEEGYGNHQEMLVQQVNKTQFEGIDDIQIGMHFEAQTNFGPRRVEVTAIDGDMITLDGNHPLVDKTLFFVVSIMDIRPATEEEIKEANA
ncbi:MAG: peptidylprolyl isomerase [Kangiellaceae bacterium]|nr:peptidylprolyl isomerase [Kangiellaceae bacterium]